MPIGPLTMIGIYIIVWWTVLFAVLPLGHVAGNARAADRRRPVGRAPHAEPEAEVPDHHLGLGDRLGFRHGADLHRLAALAGLLAGPGGLNRKPV